MDAARWHRIDEVFAAALEQPAARRPAFLDRACGDDAELRREVESLLANHGDEAFLASGAADEARQLLDGTKTDAASPADAAPEADDSAAVRAGSYELLRRLGKGGMGVVYLALRAEHDFKKHVAIKVIRKGMDSEEVLARFRRERQILSSLDHPNIARLLDGGTTDDGRPYFVMEYVQGKPVIQYCDDQKLTVNERLKLFGDVCSAVRYAHQKLVVHRDLKPGNVLVTADGTVKLLDFGIAKLLNPDVSSVDLPPTATAVRLMTPEYASPEQARGDPVTTSTDVYSLGVILYELLVGRRPYRFATRNFVDIYRVIAEEEPGRPSTVVTRVLNAGTDRLSALRGGSPRSLRKELRGDLDNIMLLALRKEPQRRYPSVEAFWEDVRRYLQGYPVHARQPTWRYRSAKYVGRHKLAVTAAAAVFILLSGFSVLLALQNRRIAEQRNAAQKAEEKAVQVTGFLVDLFKVSDPGEARGNTITAREVLDKGAEKIATELKDRPEVRAALMDTMGHVYDNLGLYDKAIPLLQEALETRKAVLGHQHLDVAVSLNNLATVHEDKGDYAGAEGLYREALAMRRRLLGDEHTDVAQSLNNLANVLYRKGDYAGAEGPYREALAMRRRLLGNQHPDVAKSLNNLANVLYKKGDFAGAEGLYREALAMGRKLLGNEHPFVAQGLNNLANVLMEEGNFAGAEGLYREALAMRRKLLGNEHPAVARSLNNLAQVLYRKGDFADAEGLYREALAMGRKLLGNEHPDVALSLVGLAETLCREQKPAEAEPLAREGVRIFRKALPSGHHYILEAESILGGCLTLSQRYEEAERLLLGSYALVEAKRGEPSQQSRRALQRIVRLYEAWGRPGLAAKYRAELAARGADDER